MTKGKDKSFNVRLNHELWTFLKIYSMKTDQSMNGVLVNCIRKIKEKQEKKLTNDDAMA